MPDILHMVTRGDVLDKIDTARAARRSFPTFEREDCTWYEDIVCHSYLRRGMHSLKSRLLISPNMTAGSNVSKMVEYICKESPVPYNYTYIPDVKGSGYPGVVVEGSPDSCHVVINAITWVRAPMEFPEIAERFVRHVSEGMPPRVAMWYSQFYSGGMYAPLHDFHMSWYPEQDFHGVVTTVKSLRKFFREEYDRHARSVSEVSGENMLNHTVTLHRLIADTQETGNVVKDFNPYDPWGFTTSVKVNIKELGEYLDKLIFGQED